MHDDRDVYNMCYIYVPASVIKLTVDAEDFVVDFFKHKILNTLVPKHLLGREN